MVPHICYQCSPIPFKSSSYKKWIESSESRIGVHLSIKFQWERVTRKMGKGSVVVSCFRGTGCSKKKTEENAGSAQSEIHPGGLIPWLERKLRVKKIGQLPDRVSEANPDN